MDIATYGAMPGNGAISESLESQVFSGPSHLQLFGTLPIKSSAVDSGSTPTTFLRPGLLLGKKTSDGLLYQYAPTAVDGTEVAYAVLAEGISMLNSAAVAEDKMGHVMLGGFLKAANIINLDNQARRQLVTGGRFVIDDDLQSKPAFLGLPLREVNKAADYTVVAADNGTLFTAGTGAVNFTLPAIAQGLAFEFLNLVDANMTVTSAEGDNIVCQNDIAADSVAFSTASFKIGGWVQVQANAAGTKWYVKSFAGPTATVTVAT